MAGPLVWAVLLSCLAAAASAASYTIATAGTDGLSCGPSPSPCRTLTYALSRALAATPTGDVSAVFLLAAGTQSQTCGAMWNDTLLSRVSSISLSPAGSGAVIVDCLKGAPFLWIQVVNSTQNLTISLSGFTITNARGTSLGISGALHVTPTDRPVYAYFSQMSFTSNTGSMAGAVYVFGGAAVADCVFAANSGDSGGGLAIVTRTGLPQSSVIRCDFQLNTAVTAGGGLYTEGTSQVSVGNTTFSSNSALLGGGMCQNARSVELVAPTGWSLTFRTNRARIGGGLYFGSGGAYWSASTFVSNTATAFGGGLYVSRASQLTLRSAALTSNTAGFRGGGGFVFLVDVLVVDTVSFDSNTVLAPPSAYEGVGSSMYLKLITTTAMFPRTVLGGSRMTLADGRLVPSTSELYCDDTTLSNSCVPCFAKSCSVCAARSAGCVQQAGQTTFCPTTVNSEASLSQPNVSSQICSCGKAAPAFTCGGHGYCWWTTSNSGKCRCTSQWVGPKCDFPLKVVLAIVLTVGPVCIGAIVLVSYFCYRIRQNNKRIKELDARTIRRVPSDRSVRRTTSEHVDPAPLLSPESTDGYVTADVPAQPAVSMQAPPPPPPPKTAPSSSSNSSSDSS